MCTAHHEQISVLNLQCGGAEEDGNVYQYTVSEQLGLRCWVPA